MGRQWSPETIPDSATLPGGAFLLTIESIEETASKAGNLMYDFNFRVKEPAALAGLPYFEHCNIGDENDPNADDPETWKKSIGARIMKRIFKATGIELGDDLDDVIAGATGQDVIAVISQSVEPAKRRDGTDNEYAGRIRNQSVGWYAVGEREVGLEGQNGGTAVAAPAAKKAPAVVQRPAAAAARPAVAAAKPVVAVKPAVAKPAAAAPAKGKTVQCRLCDPPQMIGRDEFPAHVEAHDQEQE